MDFNNLIMEIENKRDNAARFYKVDLHIHSYESHDFPKLGDKENCTKMLLSEDQEKNPQHFVDFAKKVDDLRLISITDHNKSRESAKIAKLSDKELTILPGMEATINTTFLPKTSIHILTIFPENFSSEDIEKVFTDAKEMPNYDARDSKSKATIQLDKFIGKVHEIGGICIASHANSENGIRTLFRAHNIKQLEIKRKISKLEGEKQSGKLSEEKEKCLLKLKQQESNIEDEMQNNYLEILAKFKFDAIEIQKSTEKMYYSGIHTHELGIKPISCLLHSDAHNLQDIGLKNSTSYIKMQKPNFNNLKRALQDPMTRICFEDSLIKSNFSKIIGIKFSGGFFNNQSIAFSDNLTCLIGGRGSGKSALIEALRYLFEADKSYLNKEKSNDITNRLNHTLFNTKIEVIFDNKDNDKYILSRNFGEQKTGCYTDSGDKRNIVNVSSLSDLNIKFYGWGEIEDLAKNKNDQLRLIDGFIPEIISYKDEVTEAIQDLEKNNNDILSLVDEIQTLLPKIEELPQKEFDLENINTPKMNKIFVDYDKNRSSKSSITSFQEIFQDIKEKFFNENQEYSDIKTDISGAIDVLEEKIADFPWKKEFFIRLRADATDLYSNYENFCKSLDILSNSLTTKIEGLDQDIETITSEIDNKDNMQEDREISVLISRRKTLSEEIAILKSTKETILQKEQKINELFSIRKTTLIPNLITSREKVSNLRKQKTHEINQQLSNLSDAVSVSVNIDELALREKYKMKLGAPGDNMPEGILKNIKGNYLKDNYAGNISENFSPHTFVKTIIEDSESSCLVITKKIDGVDKVIFDEIKASNVIEHLSPFIDDNHKYFDKGKLENLLKLDTIDIDDLPIIKLEEKPIEDLSPGQRCSALIPIILLESTCPLVIDQPEDNLDNRLVFDLVVDIIRSLKQKRQIIVATHNPNIPVSGDAEQIIVFESESKNNCDTTCQGSIDNEEIISKIKSIMEGSEDAFRIRAEKYGFKIST